ncbi:hypothetical protein C8R44DRAFT_918368 [Mycena epipterygia]|nr:hypothetical protein C8R44DRAFT_918368 [Mycena epipterygia]
MLMLHCMKHRMLNHLNAVLNIMLNHFPLFPYFLQYLGRILSNTLSLYHPSMVPSENNQIENQFIVPRKNHESPAHDHNSSRSTPLSPLQLHPQVEHDTSSHSNGASPKHKHSLYSAPPTPRRALTTFRPDLAALLTGPKVNFQAAGGVTAHPPPASRDPTDVDASNVATGIVTASGEDHGFGGDAFVAPQHERELDREQEDPHEVPPIAFLREQNTSVSPVSRRASPLPARAEAPHEAGEVTRASDMFSDAQRAQTASTSTSTSRSAAVGAFTFTFANSAVFAPARPRLPPSERASTPNSSSDRTRTRAETGASAHEPAPRYTYPRKHDSLIRRRAAPMTTGQPSSERWQRAGQRELEAACETTQTHVGVLPGPPAFGFEGAVALMQELREKKQAADAGETQGGGWWMQPRANTAPTAAYVALLEDAFGAGSVLRGEGPKPLGRRTGRGRGRGRGSPGTGTGASRSASASGSTGTGDAMDIDMDESMPADMPAHIASRARAWIADIQALVKGKRQMERTDLQDLAGTLREIADMDAAEGHALGDEGPRLRKSLWQLAQLENIPFGDEHRLQAWARKMVKHWPAT